MSATKAIDLQSIKCNEGSSDSVVVMTLSETGATIDTYSWIDWYENENGETEACWVDSEYNKVNGVTFQPGAALWTQGDSADQIVQSAGQVNTEDVVIQLQAGATIAGNPTPVEISIQDIVCNDGCSDSVVIMTLSETGATVDTYSWIDWYENEEGVTESCWVDSEYNKVTDVVIQPGQGLWIQGDSEDQAVTFPGVEL